MAFTITTPRLGVQPIATTQTTLSVPLGTIIHATDPTYGEGEFIYLLGVASTIVGSMVIWDGTTYATTLCPVTANMGRPLGFAMSANMALGYGWYQIAGTAIVSKSAVAIAPKVALGINSTGKIGASASGKQVLNARTANAATVASATTTIAVVINRPGAQGRVS